MHGKVHGGQYGRSLVDHLTYNSYSRRVARTKPLAHSLRGSAPVHASSPW